MLEAPEKIHQSRQSTLIVSFPSRSDVGRTTDDGRTFRASLRKRLLHFYLHPAAVTSVHRQPQRTPVRGDTPRTCAPLLCHGTRHSLTHKAYPCCCIGDNTPAFSEATTKHHRPSHRRVRIVPIFRRSRKKSSQRLPRLIGEVLHQVRFGGLVVCRLAD